MPNQMDSFRPPEGLRDASEIPLLHFIPPCSGPLRILTVDSNACLLELRQKLPGAAIFAVTEDIDAPSCETYQGLDIQWTILDYRETPLPYEKGSLDYILAARGLETTVNPQDIAAGFGTFLKDTGFLLTSFLNVRCWRILQEMMEGHFYYCCRHMFAKPEMEKLLYASFYKDAVFSPLRSSAPEGLLSNLEAAGFDNRRQDLETEIWLVKAARSTPEIAALKSLYTAPVRRTLSRLLHRIEYAVEPEANIARLWALCDQELIFPAYLAEFLRETVMHQEALLTALVPAGDGAGRESAMTEMLDTLLADSVTEQETTLLQRIIRRRSYAGGK